tara:strand:- start:10 stop:165 length:156 start_codon:yes stop_codon:yes gene_type:complete
MDAAKQSTFFSERSESVGDSNFPDNSSDLSDGQIGHLDKACVLQGCFLTPE